MEKQIKEEIHDMSEKIYDLQAKTEHLTNGQRYAAINEIEKSIAPLRNDLHHLEHKFYKQQTVDLEINKDIDKILKQISDLENLKSDLIARINTETEHTREFYHNEVMHFMRSELSPLQEKISANQKEISEVKDILSDFKIQLIEIENNRELKEAQKFDKIKLTITAIVGVFGGISALSLYFQPTIQTLVRILFGI